MVVGVVVFFFLFVGHGFDGERRRERSVKCEVHIILFFDSLFILF